jgi:hypothetical protein
MRYVAADGLSKEVINLDRNFGDVLVRARLLKEAPAPTPLMPHETVIDEEGVRHERLLPEELSYSVAEMNSGEPYMLAQSSKHKFVYAGPNPDGDNSGLNWPTYLIAEFKKHRTAYLNSLRQHD